ncbi:unnamed protein product [Schistocephalus solidus]|uniref:Nesprin-1 n=1 Tax=Schistocephalus solidus TaxID=70667 RepID=A0A183SWQ9_SCHSO|nr:unnamed protein product [Schistocephalus solidus]
MNAYFNASVGQVLTGIKRAVSEFIEERERQPRRTELEGTYRSLSSSRVSSLETTSKEDCPVMKDDSQEVHTHRRTERGKRLSMDEIFRSIHEDPSSSFDVSRSTDTARSPDRESQVQATKVIQRTGEDVQIEDVRENWNAVGQQVKERLDQLEKIIAATDELKMLERDLDRWMSRTETELASALGLFSDPSVSSAERKSTIQDIISHLPEGETKFGVHQQKCEEILSTFSKEDTQKIRSDQSNIQRRWSQLVMRLRDALEGNVQVDSDFIEIPISPRTGSRVSATYQPKMSQPSTLDRSPHGNQHPLNKSDIAFPVESRRLETSMHLDKKAQRQGHHEQRDDMGYTRAAPSNGYHGTMGEPVSTSFHEGKVENRRMERSPKLESSPSGRISTETWPLFLARLRQLNDWLSHRDAAFHQLKVPVGGNSKNVSQRLARHTALEEEIAIYRSQIEETIEKGQFFLRDQLSESQSGSYGGSEEESDSSEFDQNGFTGESEDARIATKRIARRIRRHLNYLTRRWMELNKNMLAYRLQLNRAAQSAALVCWHACLLWLALPHKSKLNAHLLWVPAYPLKFLDTQTPSLLHRAPTDVYCVPTPMFLLST